MIDPTKLALPANDDYMTGPAEAADRQVRALGAGPSDPVAWVDARVLALLRCLLAISALGILAYGGLDLGVDEGLQLLPVVAYCVYSITLLLGGGDATLTGRWLHWTDTALYTWLLIVTETGQGLLFHFFLFAIFAAAFVHGSREGLRVTLASAAGVLTAAVLTSAKGADLSAPVLHSSYLLALGTVVSCMGGYELQLRRGLRFLHEVSNVWSPRFGLERTIGLNLDRLVAFFAADSAVLLVKSEDAPACHLMYIATPRTAGSTTAPTELTAASARCFLELDEGRSVRYAPPNLFTQLAGFAAFMRHGAGAPAMAEAEACNRLANTLDARCYLSTPYAENSGVRGRLFVTSASHPFSRADLESLRQVADAIAMVLENSRLMEQLLQEASEHERYRISRDLHDATIQPYIGLKIGLQALYRESTAQESAFARRVEELVEMTAQTIDDLRNYTASLREGGGPADNGLLGALEQQVERYRRFFGLEFAVDCRLARELPAPLAAEVFHVLVEGMSNVLKHTRAQKGVLHIESGDGHVKVRVTNEIPRGYTPRPFVPRSMAERVEALGGELRIEPDGGGRTIVTATIPA